MVKYADNEYLKRVYKDIIYKDLIVRYRLRNIKQFKNLAQYLFTNFTSEASYNSLKAAKEIPDTKNTILTYNEQEAISINGIEIAVMPVWKWLINR